jgi:hypothetical protein
MKALLGIAMAVIAGFIGGVAGTLAVLHHDQPVVQKSLRAREFELVDENGQVVSIWGIDQYHNPLIAFTPSGVNKEERPYVGFSGHRLSLDDRESQRVGIGLTGAGDPFFMFLGHDEKPRASLYVNSDGKSNFLLHDENSWRVSLGIRTSDTPGPADNDWGLDFYPERAGLGMASMKRGKQSYVHGNFFVHQDEVPFPR